MRVRHIMKQIALTHLMCTKYLCFSRWFSRKIWHQSHTYPSSVITETDLSPAILHDYTHPHMTAYHVVQTSSLVGCCCFCGIEGVKKRNVVCREYLIIATFETFRSLQSCPMGKKLLSRNVALSNYLLQFHDPIPLSFISRIEVNGWREGLDISTILFDKMSDYLCDRKCGFPIT